MKTLLLSLALLPFSLFAGTPITWNYDEPQLLRNFTIYIGTNSGVYTKTINVGLAQTFTLTDLARTNYIVVSATSTNGMESPFSNELLLITPKAPYQLRTVSQLQSSDSPLGPWTPFTDLVASTIPASANHKFFRSVMTMALIKIE